jgi:ParB family chromosome partitioning protein
MRYAPIPNWPTCPAATCRGLALACITPTGVWIVDNGSSHNGAPGQSSACGRPGRSPSWCDPAGNGHRDRWTTTALPGNAGGEEASEAEREAAAAERRTTIENNKAMAAANETRREWIKGLLQRKTAPKAALRFAVETMAADPRALSRWLSGQPNRAQDSAAADLGIDAPGQWTTRDKPAPTLTSGEQVSDARLAVALLAHIAGAIESGLHRQSWRNPGAGDARWLRFLVSCGYTLAEIERQILDAAPPTADPSCDAT